MYFAVLFYGNKVEPLTISIKVTLFIGILIAACRLAAPFCEHRLYFHGYHGYSPEQLSRFGLISKWLHCRVEIYSSGCDLRGVRKAALFSIH